MVLNSNNESTLTPVAAVPLTSDLVDQDGFLDDLKTITTDLKKPAVKRNPTADREHFFTPAPSKVGRLVTVGSFRLKGLGPARALKGSRLGLGL
jgi:hypothetical protein